MKEAGDEIQAAFTFEQVQAIYRAGMRRGEDEASAYDWGTSASGDADDNLAEAIHDIANEGKGFGDPLYVTYGTARIMFEQLASRSTPSIESEIAVLEQGRVG